jgi:sulfate transport system ATP-binding protein
MHDTVSHRAIRWALRLIVIGYLSFLVIWPVALVAAKTFTGGLAPVINALRQPEVIFAFQLTLSAACWAVVINTIFGVGISLLLVRYTFPGRRALNAMVDLPLSVSPVVVGLALVLVYSGRTGWLGQGLEQAGLQVIYAPPGIIMATAFVSLPLVIREVVPVLQEIGTEQEQAARSLGASGAQTFVRITLPAIRWGLLYGVVLSLARSLGEFGAVKIRLRRSRHAHADCDPTGGGAISTVRGSEFDHCVRCSLHFSLDRRARLDHHYQSSPRQGGVKMSIKIAGVGKRFGDFVVLEDIDLDIATGELTALLGPSGGGKSTLLRIIAGLEVADSGSVEIEGVDATGLPAQRRNVGFVFQHYAAFRHLTVAGNVGFGLKVRKRPRKEIAARVKELLELVHLSQFGNRLPAQLSGGQRQRMALARALAIEPSVLLLDEPFGALDATVRKELRAWLRRLHDEVHVTTVFVTHDQEEALDVADRIVVINQGRISQIGPPDQLYDHPNSEFVMSFLGPVTTLDQHLVRPHDLEIETHPFDNA